MGRRGAMESHSFYCIKCGNRGLDIPRRVSHQYGKFHRKKLYCIYCKQEVNHIECRNPIEIEEFKENFKNGVYKDECEESLAALRCAGQW